MTETFYDGLAPWYDLLFEDWEASMTRQGEQLHAIIRARWGEAARDLLDVSCGIGTQAIGLARLGYRVTASDLSREALSRARCEAAARGLEIAFSVCDMRELESCHPPRHDVVVCADNSLPHLLDDDAITRALSSMRACLRPGGGCLVTLRDYDAEPRGRGILRPYGVRQREGHRVILFQVWDFDDDHYDFSLYMVADDGSVGQPPTRVFRSRYYAVSVHRVMELMREAGFDDVERLDGMYYQPVVAGTRGEDRR